MSSRYDLIGEDYPAVKELPVARYAELPAVRAMLGDPRGRRVLDLACGTGFYSRLVKGLGAAEVVGVDVSDAMVAAARAEEARAPLGIVYRQGDVSALGRIGEFDVALGVLLLTYATHPEQLLRMAMSIRANLVNGGSLVAVTMHPECAFGPANYTKYGFTVTEVDPLSTGGDRVRLRAEIDAGFEIDNWRWSRDVYEDALTRAGFGEIAWRPILPSQEGRAAFGLGFWQDYLSDPVLVGLRAIARS
ncbi:class I SAM-dependent methyltransferase [Sorangium sp. So ce388]|uniref:class I SAM-dependent methyltransferase n=1 Tax=Sorangium sp. So ce388 TaxID=3133309 RepID=UPI003F5C3DFF